MLSPYSVFRRTQKRVLSTPDGALVGEWKPRNGAAFLRLQYIRMHPTVKRGIKLTTGFVRPLEGGGYAVVVYDPASPFESSEWPRYVVHSEIEAVEALESMAVVNATIYQQDTEADDGICAFIA